MNEKKAATSAAQQTTNTANRSTKQLSILQLFVNLGERGLNCFQAANQHHDYVLHSTISVLQKRYGIYFSRKPEKVPNAFGGQTRCVRYWLDAANIEVAKHILGGEA